MSESAPASHLLLTEVSAIYQDHSISFLADENHCMATVVVRCIDGSNQDELLWTTFVSHRKALAIKGFRLTMPRFDHDGFGAIVERITPE